MLTAVALILLALEGAAPATASAEPTVLSKDDGQGKVTLPEFSPDPAFEPSYRIESIEVRGNHKTRTSLILRELGLFTGDVVAANDPRVSVARLRLLALGFFLDVHLSLVRGEHRGLAKLVVDVEERGTLILDAIYLGTSDATDVWGGLAGTERNLLGTGLSVGAGLVGSTRPSVLGAEPGFASALRVAGPPAFFPGHLTFQGSLSLSHKSEFYRKAGNDDSASSADFVATNVRRVGGTLGVGRAITRTFFMMGEARLESIKATLPSDRQQVLPSGDNEPIAFEVRDGRSHVGSFTLLFDFDTRSDTVLPRNGHHVSLSLEGSADGLASSYSSLKGVAQSASYFPLRSGHVIGIHGFLGGIWGDAPYFDRFFVGDLNLLLPPRALGLNFSTQPSLDVLGTRMAAHRYENVAARALVEYAVPLWRRHGILYRGDAFAAFGVFGMSNPDHWRASAKSFSDVVSLDMTGDLGLRLDTTVGIFTLSVANAIGRIPF